LIFKCSSDNLKIMARGQAKAALFDALASVAQALGSGRRAEIVDVLAQGERSVDELAREISQSVANTSQHLQVLARGGLVRSRREGTRIVYRLASDRVAELWAAVRDVAVRHVAEVSVLADEYLGDRDGVEQLSADELARRLERGDVVVLDVRPEREFRAGHIAGARSAPVDELDTRVEELPKRREIVAYCRGPYCVYADDAVRLLRSRGLKARRLEVGYPEWQRAGLPVEIAR
jgi:rhodanese-related sulfurtransferase/DNA-binding HxlR family transcriptional regulator